MTKFLTLLLLFALLYTGSGCSDDSEQPPSVQLISAIIDGVSLSSNPNNIPVNAQIVLTFSSAISQSQLIQQIELSANGSGINFTTRSSNASTRFTLTPSLNFNQNYTFTIGTGAIGQNGERLESQFQASFTTADDGPITEMNPCTSDCLKEKVFTTPAGVATFDFYSNYPIYEDNARWEKLTSALIVVHGANRNADDYYNWVNTKLTSAGLTTSTVVVAPWFKSTTEGDAGDLQWSGNGWRDGQNSSGSVNLSSFAVVDSLLIQFMNKERFPVLEEIVVTGHSSGGLFTHVYAAANKIDNQMDISLDYVVANSQYFYYPNNFRYNESNASYFEPEGCLLFNSWPMGSNNLPAYLSGSSSTDLNDQFLSRKITYFLGNANDSDPTLNTSACEATLLGSTRFIRGENAYRHTQDYFSEGNNHEKVIVNGIGHDGQGMYQSEDFTTLLGVLWD